MMYYSNYGQNFSNGFRKSMFPSFRGGSALTRLIYINCGLFFVVSVVYIPFLLMGFKGIYYDVLLEWLGVPADPDYLLYRPWTLFTYMFTHFGFFHLLFNMLWLYWFGSLFRNRFTERQLTGVYLLGGIFGAGLFILSYNIFPYFDQITRLSSWTIGASASVMAIVFAVCFHSPQQQVYIFLIGPVKMIYLALFTALIDLLSIQGDNAGGHIAHLGGAFFGWLFAMGIRSHRDLATWITCPVDWCRRMPRRKKMHVKYRRSASGMHDNGCNPDKKGQDGRINEILDKISRSGYDSLTREEKAILFKSGRN